MCNIIKAGEKAVLFFKSEINNMIVRSIDYGKSYLDMVVISIHIYTII